MSLAVKKKQKNLLTMTPILKDRYELDHASDGTTRLVVPRDGWLERLSVRFFNQPESIKVRLDKLGQYVLSRCDGSMTVQEIAERLEQDFGESAKPILPRLVKFLQMIEANEWIRWE